MRCGEELGGNGVLRESFVVEVEAADYVKAGGSELVFVQMQQNKAMEMQSKLADKVFFGSLASVSWILILVTVC